MIGSLNFLKNPTRPEAQLVVHQCARFKAYTRLPHDQVVKRILKYLKETAMQVSIMKPDPENGVKFYVDADFVGGCNQEEGKDPGLFLSRTS